MHDIYLGLGSNLGDRFLLMKAAVAFLISSGHFQNVRVSALYETAPVGYTDQPPFLNAVFRGETDLSAQGLLELCRSVESHLERVRVIRWGPRTIDADVLLVGTQQVNEPELQIPHPRMFERSFVLIPLMEVCTPEISAFYNLPNYLEKLSEQGIRKLESYEANTEWYAKESDL